MEKWLNCMISTGQFTEEFAVHGELFDGTGFSLFAEERDLKFDQKPTEEKFVNGGIRVIPGALKEDLLLVTLPHPTFENGQTITVRKDQVSNL